MAPPACFISTIALAVSLVVGSVSASALVQQIAYTLAAVAAIVMVFSGILCFFDTPDTPDKIN